MTCYQHRFKSKICLKVSALARPYTSLATNSLFLVVVLQAACLVVAIKHPCAMVCIKITYLRGIVFLLPSHPIPFCLAFKTMIVPLAEAVKEGAASVGAELAQEKRLLTSLQSLLGRYT